MAANGVGNPEVLDELEGHLREEVAQRLSSGAREQAAFEVAVECLGRPAALRVEFAKAVPKETWRRLLQVSRYIFPACILLINVWTLLAYEIPPVERGFGITAVSVICLYLVCRPGLIKFLPATSCGRLVKALKLAAGLLWLWPILALLDSLRLVDLGLGIVATVVLWCLYAAFVMIASADALNSRFRRPGGSCGPFPPWQPKGQPIPPTRPRPPEFAAALAPSQPVDPVVRKSLEVACEEAKRLGHDFVGTEHVLLGLLQLASGPFADILRRLNLDRETVRAEIRKLICPVPVQAATATLRVTPRARKAVELAAREARTLHHPGIAAEHVFLGLLLEGGGVAAVVLRTLGIHIERARAEILREPLTQPLR